MNQRTSSTAQPCPMPRLNADMAEEAILNSLSEVLVKAGHFENGNSRLLEKASSDLESHQHMKRHFNKCLSEIESELQGVFKLSPYITDGEAANLVREQLEKLALGKKQMLENLSDVELKIETCKSVVETASADVGTYELLKIFWRGWKKSTAAQKKHLLRRTYDVIYASRNGMEAHYWVYPEQT